MKPGDHVKLTARQNANQRTKNRIRERGSQGFIVKSEVKPVIGLNSQMGVCFVACQPEKRRGDQWMGWLVFDQIDVSPWEIK
jgi:hypothetical protein